MLFANWLRVSVTARRVVGWAKEVAQHSQAEVAARLSPIVQGMSMAEARGYIRARAASVLDEEMALLGERIGANPMLVAMVREAAIDEVVRLTLGDLVKTARAQLRRKAA